MGDADLDAIRAKRMSEMQEQMGGVSLKLFYIFINYFKLIIN